MLLAEAPMIDPGVVILLLVIVLLIAAAAVTTVVSTMIAGYRYGRDPSRKKAQAAWVAGLALETLAAVPAYGSLEPVWIVLVTAAIGLSAGARWLGAFLAPTPSRGSQRGPGAP